MTVPRASFIRYTPGLSGNRLRVASSSGVTRRLYSPRRMGPEATQVDPLSHDARANSGTPPGSVVSGSRSAELGFEALAPHRKVIGSGVYDFRTPKCYPWRRWTTADVPSMSESRLALHLPPPLPVFRNSSMKAPARGPAVGICLWNRLRARNRENEVSRVGSDPASSPHQTVAESIGVRRSCITEVSAAG